MKTTEMKTNFGGQNIVVIFYPKEIVQVQFLKDQHAEYCVISYSLSVLNELYETILKKLHYNFLCVF